eukprot:6209318-Pleurochrysis_carterae.AAC.2
MRFMRAACGDLERALQTEGEEAPCAPLSMVLAVSTALSMLQWEAPASQKALAKSLLNEDFKPLGPQLHHTYGCDAIRDGLSSVLVEMYALLATLSVGLGLSTTCLLNSLLLMEKVVRQGGPSLSESTIRPMMIASVVVAAKTDRDTAISFSQIRLIFPSLQLDHLASLEIEFLQRLDYRAVLFPKDDQLREMYKNGLIDAMAVFAQVRPDKFNLDLPEKYSIHVFAT